MGVISIVNGDYKLTYNWGGTTLRFKQTDRFLVRSSAVFPSQGKVAQWPEHLYVNGYHGIAMYYVNIYIGIYMYIFIYPVDEGYIST